MKRIVLIGCGIHYREKYHSVLEKRGVEIALLVDLRDREETIRAFLQMSRLQPKALLFFEEEDRLGLSIEALEAAVVDIDLSQVDGVLISTEPKPRKSYALWAAHRGWHLFMDKPVTAPSQPEQFETLLADFEEISQAVEQKQLRAVVSCERRAHLGYFWIKEYAQQLILGEKVPLTGIDLHFAGGVWKTSREYLLDENHPFRYGYGILLHSGYHYVDLLVHLLTWNDPLIPTTLQTLHIMASGPWDQLQTEPRWSNPYQESDFQGFGEVDFLMMGQSLTQDRVVTNFSLKLFGTSASTRTQEAHTPKLKGRARQEKVTLHFGHLSSIHVSSLPQKRFAPDAFPLEDFSVTVMNSPLLKDRKTIITLDRKEFSLLFPQLPLQTSMNTWARQWQLEQFLEGNNGHSPLSSHRGTVAMLHQIYQRINSFQYRKGASMECCPPYAQ